MQPVRSITTILFTDIVGSTERAAELGDRAWRELLDRHHALVRRTLARWRGREVSETGDGFLSLFDNPAHAILCATDIRDRVKELGLEVRCGLHLGQVECKADGSVGGIAVHIGARTTATAGAGEVWVTSTVRDAESGSGFGFEDRGRHELRGVPRPWQLFAVTGVPEAALPGRLPWFRRVPSWASRAAIALAVLLALAGLYVVIQDRGRSFTPPGAVEASAPGIAVLPFTVQGEGLDVWREGMVTLLSTTLDGAGDLRAIDNRTLLAEWDRVVPAGRRADRATALEVARATGARYALLGSAVGIGENLRLVAEVYGVEDGAHLGSTQVEGVADSVFALVDGLARETLDLLLEEGEGDLPSVDLAALTTTSIPALKAFLEGEALYRRGEIDSAVAAYQAAVEADSTFAMAWSRLGNACGWTQCEPWARRGRERAYQYADRLPERERLLVEGDVLFARGFLEAGERLREAALRYPNDAEVWYLLGEFYYHVLTALATSDETEEAFLRAVELDPDVGPHRYHLIEFPFRDPPDSALAAERLADLQRVSSETALWRDIALGLAFGDSAQHPALLDSLNSLGLSYVAAVAGYHLAGPRYWEISRRALERVGVTWYFFFGDLFNRGRLAEALEHVDDPGPSWFPYSWLLAATAQGVPIPERVLDEYLTLRAQDSAPSHRTASAGHYAVDRGRHDDYKRALEIHRREADRLLAEGDTLEARSEHGRVRALEGYARWKSGDPAGALPLLQEAARTMNGGAIVAWLGQLHLDLGRPGEAARHFRRIGINVPLGRYHEGVAHERAGEYSKALEAYEYFLKYWRDADPELQPMVEEARQAIIRLRGLKRE